MKNEKKSLKPLPLSQRGKKRYVLFRLESGQILNPRAVQESVETSIRDLLGNVGLAECRLQFIDFDSKSGNGIVRCSLQSCEKVKACLLFLSSVQGVSVIPEIRVVSGSLAKLKALAQK